MAPGRPDWQTGRADSTEHRYITATASVQDIACCLGSAAYSLQLAGLSQAVPGIFEEYDIIPHNRFHTGVAIIIDLSQTKLKSAIMAFKIEAGETSSDIYRPIGILHRYIPARYTYPHAFEASLQSSMCLHSRIATRGSQGQYDPTQTT